MSARPAPGRPRHPWALGIGLVLLVPQVVLAFLVVGNPVVVGLSGFAMTIGFIRLGTLAYRVARERVPPVHRGILAVVGLVATVVGSLLFAAARSAADAAADVEYGALLAPAHAVGIGLVVIASTGLYLCGLAVLVASVVGAVAGARARSSA